MPSAQIATLPTSTTFQSPPFNLRMISATSPPPRQVSANLSTPLLNTVAPTASLLTSPNRVTPSLTAIRLPPNLTSPLLTNYSGMTLAHATLAYAFPTLNKTSAKSCSEKPPRQPSHSDPCWTTRLQLPSLTPFMPSSLNPSFSTGWNNGYPIFTPARWLKKVPPPHMPPPPPNSQRTKPIRIWPMPTTSSTPPPPHWLSGLNLGRIQHISQV